MKTIKVPNDVLDASEHYRKLRHYLESYDPELWDKHRIDLEYLPVSIS